MIRNIFEDRSCAKHIALEMRVDFDNRRIQFVLVHRDTRDGSRCEQPYDVGEFFDAYDDYKQAKSVVRLSRCYGCSHNVDNNGEQFCDISYVQNKCVDIIKCRLNE